MFPFGWNNWGWHSTPDVEGLTIFFLKYRTKCIFFAKMPLLEMPTKRWNIFSDERPVLDYDNEIFSFAAWKIKKNSKLISRISSQIETYPNRGRKMNRWDQVGSEKDIPFHCVTLTSCLRCSLAICCQQVKTSKMNCFYLEVSYTRNLKTVFWLKPWKGFSNKIFPISTEFFSHAVKVYKKL